MENMNKAFKCMQVVEGAENREHSLSSIVLSESVQDVKAAIQNKSEINEQDPHGNTAILFAAAHDLTDTAEILLAAGSDVNITNHTGHSPLHYAVLNGNLRLVQYLIKHGANVDESTQDDWNTALHFAVLNGDSDCDIVQELHKAGANVLHTNINGKTAFHVAVEKCQMEMVQYFLQKDVNPNHLTTEGVTALHIASSQGCTSMCKLLLQGGAEPDVCWSPSPLHLAAMKHAEVTQMFVEYGADVNCKDQSGNTPLHYAATTGSEDSIHVLLKAGATVNALTCHEFTPLMLAAMEGRERVVDLLITAGGATNQSSDNGYTALHFSASSGNLKVCQRLVNADAEVNVVNNVGDTPLISAARGNFYDVAEFLLSAPNMNSVNHQDSLRQTALFEAARHGNDHMVAALLQGGADVALADGKGNTPLMIAAKGGFEEVVSYLLSHDPDNLCVNLDNQQRETALHFAANSKKCSDRLVQQLLSAGADVHAKTLSNETPLAMAALRGNTEAVHHLLAAGSAVNVVDFLTLAPLHRAVAGGHVECVKMLLDAKADVSLQNAGTGNTALLLAVDRGCIEVVHLLIQANCNVNGTNGHERAPLHQAAEKGATDIIELLLPAGAYVNMQTSEGDTPLLIACRKGHQSAVKILLEVKSDVNMRNRKRLTALHEAATYGYVDIVRLLLNYGADKDVLDLEQDSPLSLAALKGHKAVVDLLVKSHCKLDLINDMGRTALIEAAENKNVAIVDLLIKAGTDANIQDYEGDNALIVAAAKGHFKVVQCLVNAGCDLKMVNKYGRTALHEACSVWTPSYHESVEALLDAGVDPDIQDYMGNTPLLLATLSGREIVVWLLLRANCNVNLIGWSTGKSMKPLQVAVTSEKTNIVKMLTFAGADLNSVNIWLDTPSGPRYMVPVTDKELKAWLMEKTLQPPSLKNFCRQVIRKPLGQYASVKISSLPLPAILRAYLDLEDLKEFIPSINPSPVPVSTSQNDWEAMQYNIPVASVYDNSNSNSVSSDFESDETV